MKLLPIAKTAALILLIVSKLLIVAASLWGVIVWLSWGMLFFLAFIDQVPGAVLVFPQILLFIFWLLFCIFSTFGILKTKWLLISGVILQGLVFCSIHTLSEIEGKQDILATELLKLFLFYAGLWWLHFLLTYAYQAIFKKLSLGEALPSFKFT